MLLLVRPPVRVRIPNIKKNQPLANEKPTKAVNVQGQIANQKGRKPTDKPVAPIVAQLSGVQLANRPNAGLFSISRLQKPCIMSRFFIVSFMMLK